MCIREIFTEVRPDGRIQTWSEADYCGNARHGQFCDRTQELRRPPGYRRVELPPTPPLSYHSDYASDSERSSKRRSGMYIKDNMLDAGHHRRSSQSQHERQRSGDRIVYTGSSPLSRTPPVQPRSISPSPARDSHSSSYRDNEHRPRQRSNSIKIDIINERPKTHHRTTSSSKTISSRDSSDEERRQRRTSVHFHDDRQRQKFSEIARQNEAIASRNPIPQVPPSPSTRYRRGSVSILPASSVQERMRLDDEKRQRQREKKEAEAREREEEAQRQRLKDRFNIKN